MKRIISIIKNKKEFVFALADGVLLCFAFAVAYLFRPVEARQLLPWLQMLEFLLCNLIVLIASGNYQILWQYSTARYLLRIAVSLTAGSVVYAVICLISREQLYYVFLPYLLSITFICGSRLIYRAGIEYYSDRMTHAVTDAKKTRVMIVGAGAAGNLILREMKRPDSDLLPVLLVDDDIYKQGHVLLDVPIKGVIADIPSLCEQYQIDTIVVAIPSCSPEEEQEILKHCSQTGCKVRVIPHLDKLLLGEDRDLLSQTHDLNTEDLLGREAVHFDNAEVKKLISGKVCMVTGGGGSIGSELCRQIAHYGPKQLIIVDIYENNAYDIQQQLFRMFGSDFPLIVEIASVRDYHKMNLLFARYRPQLVYHAAAHKHVPLMETAPEESVKNNVLGTFHVAALCDAYAVERMVLVSTDKAVNPTNVMGATKRCCELIMQYMAQQSETTKFITVRFGNVLGSNGSVVPLFCRQIETGGPVTITHPEIIRYFMTIPEASSLILQASAIAKSSEIFVLNMGEPVKILDLAKRLIRHYGLEPDRDIKIEFTGLRPGEKLYEELLMAEEGLQKTANEKIFIGNLAPVNFEVFIHDLRQLEIAAREDEREQVVELLQRLVPTFHHQS